MPHSVSVSKLMIPPNKWPQLRADTDVSTAIKILRIITEDKKLEHGHSTPVVMDEDFRLLGFVHLVDLLKAVRHLCDKNDRPCDLGGATMPLRDLVVPFVGSVGPDDSILKALDIMMDNRVSLVPVLAEGKLKGIIKLSDLFGEVSELLFDETDPDERRKLMRDHRV
jgi:CBS domain-containing protein